MRHTRGEREKLCCSFEPSATFCWRPSRLALRSHTHCQDCTCRLTCSPLLTIELQLPAYFTVRAPRLFISSSQPHTVTVLLSFAAAVVVVVDPVQANILYFIILYAFLFAKNKLQQQKTAAAATSACISNSIGQESAHLQLCVCTLSLGQLAVTAAATNTTC